ncbi:NADAR family protein [Flavobacterium sp. H122]|uniref:NADAR family protein n=1 Tax=Flavobacterium sp. H122 TaxID=2529860 RepID=UPI0010A9B87F|nr:NADAR family protein [Flavobacterium sp. H122]
MSVSNYLNDFIEYNESDEELEFFIRMNAEWNEDSFKKLYNILMLFFENCKDENEIPKEIDYLFNSSISRIIDIISSPPFTNNNFIGLSSLEYKDFIQSRISVLNELKKIYENRLFLKYCFFYGYDNPLSQWYSSEFSINDMNFTSAEQWMMYSKAKLFNDNETMLAIIQEHKPNVLIKLGRRVKGFKEDIWLSKRREILYEGNYAKFSQDDNLKSFLKNTNKMILAEASSVDLIWGIGFSVNDLNRFDQNKWRGLNLLGEILMDIRAKI